KLSPWSEGIGEADSLPSVAVSQKSKISKIECSGRFLKFTIDFGEFLEVLNSYFAYRNSYLQIAILLIVPTRN
ncbi:MAG: hypothetical protein IJB64_04770, partial [Akkermansia sp.]|nr:hypothetical protein [Akkermansia sp.]